MAFVTGGASGIGLACAHALDAAGYTVVSTRHNQPVPGFASVPCDVTDDAQVEAAVAAVEAEHGPIEVLVSNAGFARLNLVLRTTATEVAEVLDANLLGATHVARHVAASMVRRRRGRIVFVSSVAAFHGVPGCSSYSAAKAGIIGFSRALARELGGRNITVNVVCPGLLQNAADVYEGFGFGSRNVAGWVEATPLRRLGTVEEAAGAVAFLASPQASFITGAVLPVDGGFAMGF